MRLYAENCGLMMHVDTVQEGHKLIEQGWTVFYARNDREAQIQAALKRAERARRKAQLALAA